MADIFHAANRLSRNEQLKVYSFSTTYVVGDSRDSLFYLFFRCFKLALFQKDSLARGQLKIMHKQSDKVSRNFSGQLRTPSF